MAQIGSWIPARSPAWALPATRIFTRVVPSMILAAGQVHLQW